MKLSSEGDKCLKTPDIVTVRQMPDAYSITILLQQESPAAACEPLSIAALASYLRAHGHVCRIIQYPESVDAKSLARELVHQHPVLVGISVLSYATRQNAISLLAELSELDVKFPTCVGGYEPSLSPEDWVGVHGLDLIVQGEGEVPLLAIVDALSAGDDTIIQNPPRGVMSTHTNAPATRGDRVGDLDTLPFPSREALPTMNGKAIGEVGVVSGRGCYARCAFCAVHHFARLDRGRAFRQRSVENVVEEMKCLYTKFSAWNFYFYDDVFTLPGRHGALRAREFRDALLSASLEVTYGIYQRPDCVVPEIIGPLVECGLNRVFVGIESFSDEDLRYFAKNASGSQHVAAMETFESFGFLPEPDAERRVRVGMIPFHPFTSLQSLRDNVEKCMRFRIPPKRLTLRLEIYPHTQSETEARREGLLNSDMSWNFRDVEVEAVERQFRETVSIYSCLRDPIRDVEKGAAIAQIDLMQDVTRCRREMDERTLHTLWEIVNSDLGDAAATTERLRLHRAALEDLSAKVAGELQIVRSQVEELRRVSTSFAVNLAHGTSNVFDQSHFRDRVR